MVKSRSFPLIWLSNVKLSSGTWMSILIMGRYTSPGSGLDRVTGPCANEETWRGSCKSTGLVLDWSARAREREKEREGRPLADDQDSWLMVTQWVRNLRGVREVEDGRAGRYTSETMWSSPRPCTSMLTKSISLTVHEPVVIGWKFSRNWRLSVKLQMSRKQSTKESSRYKTIRCSIRSILFLLLNFFF